jgi:transcriptional regulator with XRE-family HTH domain
VEPAAFSGPRLAAARRTARLTQRALAAELGVTVRTLQNYEAGRFVPFRHLHDLERILGTGLAPAPADSRRALPAITLIARSRRERARLAENRRRLGTLLDELGRLVADQQASAGQAAPPAAP